jgi:DNA-binding transcriptional LysR family regulator
MWSLAAHRELTHEAKMLRSPRRKLLRVGFSSLLGAQRLALLFEPFAREHQGVEVIYKECSHDHMESRLEAGTIDVVCGTNLSASKSRSRHMLFREPLRWIAPHAADVGDSVTLREVARTRLLLTDGSCGLAPATRELMTRARLSIDEYAGHAISYAALEEWAELGIGGAILPISHIRKAKSAALVKDDKPITLTYEAVWRKDLVVGDHTKAFVAYLRTVVSRLARGIAPT